MKLSNVFYNSNRSESLRCLFVGAFSAMGYAPFNLCFPFILGFAWFFYRVLCGSIRKRYALLFFLGFHEVCLYWLVYPLTISIEKHWFLIPFAIIVAPTILSIFYLYAIYWMQHKIQDIWEKVFSFVLIYCSVHYFMGVYFPQFPWVAPGYIFSFHEIFLQTLSIYGIYGLSYVAILLSSIVGACFAFREINDIKNCKKCYVIIVGIILSLLVFGVIRLQKNKTEYTSWKAKMVQCNISQHEKINKNLSFANLNKHIDLSRHNDKCDFIIWPEASIPYLYYEDFERLHDFLKIPLQEGEYLIAGAVRMEQITKKIFNSVVCVDHLGKNIGVYDKIRLVPFGEYIPCRKYLSFRNVAGDIGDFDIGSNPKIVTIKDCKMAMAICYEAVFPREFLPKRHRADVIINITNDAWFGFTSQPFQHLQIVRARSIEEGIPLIRVTNFGISAAYDSFGREIARIPINQSGYMDFYIPKAMEKTIYSKFGDLVFFLLLAYNLLLILIRKKNAYVGYSQKFFEFFRGIWT